MAQIFDRSPHQGCEQTEGKEAVSMTGGGFKHFNTPEVHMNTQWSWREDGGGVAGTMSHRSSNGTWLAWVEWGHLEGGGGGGHVTMRWMRGPLLTTKRRGGGGVFLISQYWDKRASFIHGTKSDSLGPAVINCATTLYFYSEHVAGSTVHTYTKIREKHQSLSFSVWNTRRPRRQIQKKQKCTPWSDREELSLFCLSANVLLTNGNRQCTS